MVFDGPLWEGVYSNFRDVPAEGAGFDGDEWARNSLNKITSQLEQIQKEKPMPPVSNYRECLLPFLASLIYQQKGELRILDFGGGIGLTYYQTVYGIPPKAEHIEYHIVEREAVCKVGTEFFGKMEPLLFFHSSLTDVKGACDIIYLGSVLQYIEDWRKLLINLCALKPAYLLMVDVYAGNIPTFASASYYYGSTIPMWFLNIDKLLQTLDGLNYRLVFKSTYQPTILGREQELPMSNFEEKYQLANTCNLLFILNKK